MYLSTHLLSRNLQSWHVTRRMKLLEILTCTVLYYNVVYRTISRCTVYSRVYTAAASTITPHWPIDQQKKSFTEQSISVLNKKIEIVLKMCIECIIYKTWQIFFFQTSEVWYPTQTQITSNNCWEDVCYRRKYNEEQDGQKV